MTNSSANPQTAPETTPMPAHAQSVTASLVVKGAAQAIELYKSAFGAKEEYRMQAPGKAGDIMHASIVIGNSRIFLADVNPEMGCAEPSVSGFYVYFDDVDAVFAQAKKAGMQEFSAVKDMFWGDRTGSVQDRFGIRWALSTHVRDVSPEDMEVGRKRWAATL